MSFGISSVSTEPFEMHSSEAVRLQQHEDARDEHKVNDGRQFPSTFIARYLNAT